MILIYKYNERVMCKRRWDNRLLNSVFCNLGCPMDKFFKINIRIFNSQYYLFACI